MFTPKGEEENAVTGCVATAAGILMQYHQYPSKFEGGVISWTSNKGHQLELPDGTVVSNERQLSIDLDQYTFDWSLMPSEYLIGEDQSVTFTADEALEVSKLMVCIGAVVNMDYDAGETGGSGATFPSLQKGLVQYMQYPSTRSIERNSLSDAHFERIMREEIDADRPIIYGSVTGAHVFISDGYSADPHYFHFNMGWGGRGNGFYPLDAIIPEQVGAGAGSMGDYSDGTLIFYNLKPSAKEEPQDILTYISQDAQSEKNDPLGIYPTDLDQPITAEKPFQVDLYCPVPKTLYGNHTIQLAVAHTDATGQIKEIVSQPQAHTYDYSFLDVQLLLLAISDMSEEEQIIWFQEHPDEFKLFTKLNKESDVNLVGIDCQIKQPIEEGDRLVGVSSQDEGQTWLQIICMSDDDDVLVGTSAIELTVPTANETIVPATEARIYTAAGQLCIDEAEGTARIYNVAGANISTIQVNGSARLTLPQGTYVINLNKRSHKVVVQ